MKKLSLSLFIIIILLFITSFSFGQFGSQQIISNYAYDAFKVISCDVDGDGDNDVIYSSTNSIAWCENTDGLGSFGFQQYITYSLNLSLSICAIDIDNDGDSDVVYTSYNDNTIAWYENTNGLGNFGAHHIISDSTLGASSVCSIDIDGDGDKDIVSASNLDSTIAWYENTDGLGTFGSLRIVCDTFTYVNVVYTTDVDNDGDYDIIAGNHMEMGWYKNDGNGIFTFEQIITTSVFYLKTIYSGDIDGDGDMDILSGGIDAKVAWYENIDGLGTFGTQQVIAMISDSLWSVKADDLDGDGDLDVMSASRNKIAWYENIDGDGSFSPIQLISTNVVDGLSIFCSDIDGDGDKDILSASYSDHKIAWYENHFNSPFKVKGQCFYDENQNGQKDVSEDGIGFIQTNLQPNGLASYSGMTGEYWFSADTGTYILSYIPLNNWNLTSDSIDYHVVLTDTTPLIDSLDFGFYPDTIFNELSVELTIGQHRCDEDVNQWINIINQGTTTPDCIIELVLDPQLTFVSSAISPDSINGQTYYWNFDSIFYFSEEKIKMIVHTPDFNSMGDTLNSIVNVYVNDTSGNYIFSDTLTKILTCSYDPNDKLVSPKGTGTEGIVPLNEVMEYTVRFQNTGNDTAINIKIRDQIDENLDINSLQLLGSSHHSVDVYIQQNRWLVFQFDSIMLPDSTTDFLGSQGFVKYRIAIDPSALPNQKIYNTADIYFDNNPAVITNTVINTVECYISPIPPDIYQTGNDLYVSTSNTVQWYLNDTMLFNANDTLYTPLQDGDYMVEVADTNGCTSFSDVYTYIGVGFEESNEIFDLNIYPNPTTGMIYFWTVGNADIEEVEVLDIKGNLIYSNTKLSPIDLNQQAKGIYFVKVVAEQGVVVKKVMLQ